MYAVCVFCFYVHCVVPVLYMAIFRMLSTVWEVSRSCSHYKNMSTKFLSPDAPGTRLCQAPDNHYIYVYIQDVVNCIGGIQVLFPLLEQVNKVPIPKDILSPDAPVIENLNKSVEHEDWLVVPSSSYAGELPYC